MMVGFWQRSSGAKQGVGSINTGVVEFQLPENAHSESAPATLQFRARASQCAGAEPVLFEVFGYAGNGRADPADAISGVRLAQLTANCSDNPAFAQPFDVTNVIRQLSVPSGLRFVGFNVRKMNHRALPSYFGFSAAKLTIVVASEDLAIGPVGPIGAQAGAGSAAPGTQGRQSVALSSTATESSRDWRRRRRGRAAGRRLKPAREQARARRLASRHPRSRQAQRLLPKGKPTHRSERWQTRAELRQRQRPSRPRRLRSP
jgi:hypothetical protein